MFKKLKQKIAVESPTKQDSFTIKAEEKYGEPPGFTNPTERPTDTPSDTSAMFGSTDNRASPVPRVTEEIVQAETRVDQPELSARKRNLAAQLLQYGEEISSKNNEILRLENIIALIERDAEVFRTNIVKAMLVTFDDYCRQATDFTHMSVLRRSLEEQVQNVAFPRSDPTLAENTSSTGVANITHDTSYRLNHQQREQLHSQAEMVTTLQDALQQTERTFSSKLSSLQSTIDTLRRQLSECARNIDEKEKALSESQQQVQLLKDELLLCKRNDSVCSGDEVVIELRSKLQRAVSLAKTNEAELEANGTELARLQEENSHLKSQLEASKHMAVSELLQASEDESALRENLAVCQKKLALGEAQLRSQFHLLEETQRALSSQESKQHAESQEWLEEKEKLLATIAKNLKDFDSKVESLQSSLEMEKKTSQALKEQLDLLREDSLEKQLTDENHLSELETQLVQLKGELKQLEREKKVEADRLKSERDQVMVKLEQTKLSCDNQLRCSREDYTKLQLQLDSTTKHLSAQHDEICRLEKQLRELTQTLQANETERDSLLLRNADLSVQLEKDKVSWKERLSLEEQEKGLLKLQLAKSEESRGSLHQQVLTLTAGASDVEQHRRSAAESEAVIKDLQEKINEQELIITERNKLTKMQLQTIADLKKTIKQEMRGVEDVRTQAVANSELNGEGLKVRQHSMPDLEKYAARGAKCDSPSEEEGHPRHVPHAQERKSVSRAPHSANSLPHSMQPMNGSCDQKDVNLEYLKNVVFKFLVCRDSEAKHLVKALTVLLDFDAAEEKLLRDTLDYRMSWWATKPQTKVRK